MEPSTRFRASGLFLTELILAILFFSVAGAVCLQVFAKSHRMSRDARRLELAVSECSSAAELLEASGDEAEALSLLRERYPLAESSSDGLVLLFDRENQPCGESDADLVISIRLSTHERLLTARLTACRAGDTENIYALELSHHLQRRPDHAF